MAFELCVSIGSQGVTGYTRMLEGQTRHPHWNPQDSPILSHWDPQSSPQPAWDAGMLKQQHVLHVLSPQPAVAGDSAAAILSPHRGLAKWGFVPGEDDTMDINPENRGMLIYAVQPRAGISSDVSPCRLLATPTYLPATSFKHAL